MQGVSSKAVGFGDPRNKRNLFQDQELDDDLGINYYEFKYRNYDPQIGRFLQIDPLADKYFYNGTYVFSENHVTSHVELEGLEKKSIHEIQLENRREQNLARRREASQNAQREALGLNKPLPRAAIDNVAEGSNKIDPNRNIVIKARHSGSHSDQGGWLLTVDGGGTGLNDNYGKPDGDPINVTGFTISLQKPDPEDMIDWAHLVFEAGKTNQEQKDENSSEGGDNEKKDATTSNNETEATKPYSGKIDPMFLKKNNTVYHRQLGFTTKQDGKGGGWITTEPARDTFPRKPNEN